MTVTNPELRDQPDSGIWIARLFLIVASASVVLALLNYDSMVSGLWMLCFMIVTIGSLVLVPILVLKRAKGRKSVLYAVALMIGIPVLLMGFLSITSANMRISHERARTFIAAVKKHAAVTGVLPETETELKAASIAIPVTVFGAKMNYRTTGIRYDSWKLYADSKEIDKWKANTSVPEFVVSFNIDALTTCVHFSRTDFFFCDD